MKHFIKFHSVSSKGVRRFYPMAVQMVKTMVKLAVSQCQEVIKCYIWGVTSYRFVQANWISGCQGSSPVGTFISTFIHPAAFINTCFSLVLKCHMIHLYNAPTFFIKAITFITYLVTNLTVVTLCCTFWTFTYLHVFLSVWYFLTKIEAQAKIYKYQISFKEFNCSKSSEGARLI